MTEAQAFLQFSKDYFDSFELLTSRLWDLLSGPHRRATEKEMNDFVAGDDEVDEDEDGGDAKSHMQLHHQWNIENDEGLITREDRDDIERYGREEEADEEASDDLKDSDSQVVEEDGDVQNYYTTASEEDEWEAAINKRRKAKTTPKKAPRKLNTLSARRNSLSVGNELDDSARSSAKKRRVIQIQDSDEE